MEGSDDTEAFNCRGVYGSTKETKNVQGLLWLDKPDVGRGAN